MPSRQKKPPLSSLGGREGEPQRKERANEGKEGGRTQYRKFVWSTAVAHCHPKSRFSRLSLRWCGLGGNEGTVSLSLVLPFPPFNCHQSFPHFAFVVAVGSFILFLLLLFSLHTSHLKRTSKLALFQKKKHLFDKKTIPPHTKRTSIQAHSNAPCPRPKPCRALHHTAVISMPPGPSWNRALTRS